MEPIQPTENIGNTVANLPSNSDAGGTAPAGAQVVNGLHVNAEVFGELTRGQDGLKTESEEVFVVHDLEVFEVTPNRSN